MAKLAQYLKNYRKEVILGPLFKLLEAIFELIVPLIMAGIIDNGVNKGDGGYILRMGVVMVLLGVAGLLCAIVCQYFAARASQGFGTDIRNGLFSKINSFSLANMDKFGVSSLITRLTNDANQLQLAVAMLIRLVIRAPFLVIGATAMAFTINAKIAVIFLVVALLIALVLYLIMNKTSVLYKAIQKMLDRLSLITRENLRGTRVVRAFSRQKQEEARFSRAAGDIKKQSLAAGVISALLNPLTYAIVNAGIIAVLWFGAGSVGGGTLVQGEVVALINYLTQILLALLVVADLVIIFTKASASAQRVSEVLLEQPAVQDTGTVDITKVAGHNESHIEFRGVDFIYPGGSEKELVDASFKIDRGGSFGIIGGTGAGKTTLVNLLLRFYDTTDGSIFIKGTDIKECSLKSLRQSIAIVPQKASLFSGTVRQNMLVGNESATDEMIKNALVAAQAWEFISKTGRGLEYELQTGARNLSGGQKQRLCIARALLREPEILILDDSTSALDFATEAALFGAIAGYGKAMTRIIVSQRASALLNADAILVLDDGNTECIGTHAQLKENCAIYREIIKTQFEETANG